MLHFRVRFSARRDRLIRAGPLRLAECLSSDWNFVCWSLVGDSGGWSVGACSSLFQPPTRDLSDEFDGLRDYDGDF